MENEDIIAYPSSFLPNININVVFKENPNYPQLKSLFEQYGYGFLAPEFKTIFLDGEIFLGDEGLTYDDLKFIEAHEISHIIMGHDGPRSEEDEIDADLGAYILLKQAGKTDSIKTLLKQFKNRHGIKFEEKLLDRVKNYFS